MAATVGYDATIKVASAFGGPYTESTGIRKFTLSNSRDIEDTTCFSDNANRRRTAKLEDWTLDLEGFFVDEAPQGLFRSLFRSGAAIFFKLYLNSGETLGYQAASSGGGAIADGITFDTSPDSLITFKTRLLANQALELIGAPES